MENIKERESVMIEIVCTSNCVICDKSIVIAPKEKTTDDIVENDDYVDDDDDEYSYCEECRNNNNDSYDDKNEDTEDDTANIPVQYKKFIKYNYPGYVKEDSDYDDYEDEDDLYEKAKQNLLNIETDDECYLNQRDF